MSRSQIVQQIIREGVVAVIRMSDPKKLMNVARAIQRGGISALEITMTTPNALRVIEDVAAEMGEEVLVGVGSVLDAETARLAIDAGARYVVSPIFNLEIIQVAHRYGVPAVPGAFTPTEALVAHESGEFECRFRRAGRGVLF